MGKKVKKEGLGKNDEEKYDDPIDLAFEQRKMSKSRRVILLLCAILVVALVIILARIALNESTKDRIQNMENEAPKWKSEALISPAPGDLKAAGSITIEWQSADNLGEVKGYKVYVDGKNVCEGDAKTTQCEYYSTKVCSHDVYIEADLNYDSKIYSDVYTFYVNKKGFCVNRDMAQNIDAKDWGVSWYYNWAFEPFKYTSFEDLEYVPMMWTSYPTDADTIRRFSGYGYKYILAFNEPDMSDQSNLSVEEAVSGMAAFMDQGLLVGAPATAQCPPWSDNWFVPFMEQLNDSGMDVDFIPIHHYWNWFDKEGADAFIDLVKETYDMYQKPIWITEFAISGDPGKDKEQRQKVIDYMEMVIPMLDDLDFVERYAWFSFNPDDTRNGASSLMQYYEGTITDLGYLYQDLGMPTGYGKPQVVLQVKNSKEDVIK